MRLPGFCCYRLSGLLLLLLSSLLLPAQGKRDSLLAELSSASADSVRINTLYQLAMYHENTDLDSATFYLQALRKLADASSSAQGEYMYHERMAVVLYSRGNHKSALAESREGLNVAQKLHNLSYQAAMLNMMAICHQYLGEYREALDYVLQAHQRATEANDTLKIVQLYNAFSIAYANLGQHRKAIEAGRTGLYLRELYHIPGRAVNRLYVSIAQSYDVLGMRDSAEYFYDRAVISSRELNDKFAECTVYKFLNQFYAAAGYYEKMLPAAERSLQLAREVKSRQLEATAYLNLGSAHYYNGRNGAARDFIDQALAIGIADSIRATLHDGYRLLSYIAAREGDFLLSVRSQGKADSIQQASLNEEVAKSAADLEKKYESEKKESQIKLQQATIRQKNTINYILFGSIAAVLVIGVLIYRNHRNQQRLQRQRISELETEKQLLATQSLLKGQEDERSRLAKDLHDGLGGLLSGVKLQLGAMKGSLVLSDAHARSFNLALSKLDESIGEMRRVAHNMMPEALLNMGLQQALQDYCDGLAEAQPFSIHGEFHGLEERMTPSVEIVLYRIVQELLNNAVKHAAADRIVAQVIRAGDRVSVTVEDNGKGFVTFENETTHTAGLRNIRSRVAYLHGQMDIQSSPGKGTSVHIECSIDHHEQPN